jgi:hypothetical protein
VTLLISSGGFVAAGALAGAAVTRHGHSIEVAVLRFLLFYAGVFALIALTAAVGIGLLATDRIVMLPGGRIIAQGVHRAVSFGAVGFLAVHILTEVLTRRSAPDDAVVPFLDHGRTLYLGLGTVASDLVLLIVVTGIMRGRFAATRPAWMWRALHATSYAAWPLAILHGLLAGRTAKPYVDWSYGACIAAVGLALVIRVVAGVRVREMAGNPVPALGPWLPAGAGSPLERASSLPLAYGGRERLAIAAPVAQEVPANDEPFDGELLDGPPYEQQDDEPGDYQPDQYGKESEYGSREHTFAGFAAHDSEAYYRVAHDPGLPDSGPYGHLNRDPGSPDSGPYGRMTHHPGPAYPGPVHPGPVHPAPVHPAPVYPAPITPGPVASGPVYPGPITPGPHNPGPYGSRSYARTAYARAAYEQAVHGRAQYDRVAPGYDSNQGGPYGGGQDDLPPPDHDVHYRGPYDPDLYGPEPPTDPRMYAPPLPENWSADASGRWPR